MSQLKVNIEYLHTINYALFHNRIEICRWVEMTNTSENALRDVQLTVEGEFVDKTTSDLLAEIGAGETLRISSLKIVPNITQLANLTERVATNFTLSITAEESTIYEEKFDIDLMPYDHWLGTTTLPQTIASFVTPNHPAINEIVVRTAAKLKELTGSSSLSEYQTGNANAVRAQVAAAFAAVHQQGIIYRSVPASYEDVGQRVTLPDQVLATKIGNCIELTLLMASVLEAIGINAGVVIMQGHAYLGVWLVDDCYPSSVCDDASFIEKKMSRGINEMLVLECTCVADETASFGNAVKMAEQNLANLSLFEMFIDIRRCRLERILPLPTRIENNGKWEFDISGVAHDACILDVKEHDRYDLSKILDGNNELTKFDIWERKLLDFSLRNSLLNMSLRRKVAQFISFDIDKIEDHLQDGEEYQILNCPEVEFSLAPNEKLVRSKLFEELHELIRNDIDHHLLRTYLSESETKDVLKNIYRAAKNAIEETGANSLFLSIGTLRWYENEQSETPRYAPLLLLPVEIVYKKSNYYIRSNGEDISLNITLIEYLKQIHNIKINGINPLPKDKSGVDVPLIFAAIREALKEQRRWDVEEECLLGNFSFSKFLMWNDIHSHQQELRQNDIILSLVENRLVGTHAEIVTDMKSIDSQTSPTEVALPVPVDSSQMSAVIEAGKGHSFILYGPPGTGKSQTITNLIANALYHGKRVLFVAEKMAALSVVQNRLAKIGLDPFCLELHSNKSTKRHVLQQLEKALKVTHIVPPANFAATAEKIFEQRRDLIAYMEALHDVDKNDGLSLYDCLLHYESIDSEPLTKIRITPELNQLLASEGVKAIDELLGGKLETIVKLVGQPSEHPLNGLHLVRNSLTDSNFVESIRADKLNIAEIMHEAETLKTIASLKKQILRDNSPEILNENGEKLRRQWREANAKWFLPRFFAKRNLLKKLQIYNPLIVENEIEPLLNLLIEYGNYHARIEQLRTILQHWFGISSTEDQLPDPTTTDHCIARMERWIANTSLMRDWIHWSEYSDLLAEKGLISVVEAMEQTTFEPNSLRIAFQKALFKQKAEDKIAASKMLATFEGMLFEEKVAAYKRMAEDFQLLTQKELYARLAARIPRVTDNVNASSEIGFLNRNISNGGRGVSLRDLFEQTPTLLPRLCPCMLMSPMSVAQYLDLANEKFDLVVFDEASQMPTSEAVGAIARGKALIVVGDPKQMPPTSFFTSTNVDTEEAVIDDMESILEDCRTLEIPSLQLSWHYRSRHESLIAFSNNEYYNGSLITFPSVDDKQTKVCHIPIEGYYDKGGRRQNKAEAKAIVNEIERRLSDKTLCQKSIGVISFSVVQQMLIEDMLQALLDNNRALQEAAEAMYEPIFVKNLENVQGDERDVILFSIGYGPDKEGKVSMNFGPLNNAGGERRLNVAVSRAREEMWVFSTLKSKDVDLKRSKARGVEGLKHFLAYAETHSLPLSSENRTAHQDTAIARQIAAALREKGYETSTNIGRSQFKIDVAVSRADNPEVYLLGILLDGEGYRNTHTTRDREIVQPSVLANLDWRIMRVRTIDWFNNRERVLNRIEEQLNAAPIANEQNEKATPFTIDNEQIEEQKTAAIDYNFCKIGTQEAQKMTDFNLTKQIIATEQPINFTLLCRRVCELRELGRVTPTLQKTLAVCLDHFYKDEYNALWLNEKASENYENYRPNSGRDITDIPTVELCNALCETLAEQVALNADNLILVASKKLGFSRRGANVQAAFEKALQHLATQNKTEQTGENIRLKN